MAAVPKKKIIPSRAQQLASKKQTWVECRAYGHMRKATMRYGAHIGDVHYSGYITEVMKCVRDIDGPCGFHWVIIYDGQLGLVERHEHAPPGYAIKGQGRGKYRQEAKKEILARG